jgi:CubicO group peptidase (beta-lactamase class C family)
MEKTVYYSHDLPEHVKEAVPIVGREDVPALVARLASHGLDGEAVITGRTPTYVSLVPCDILPVWSGAKGPAEDAVLFARLWLRAGQGIYGEVLQPATVKEMLRTQKSTGGEDPGMGLGWWLGSHKGWPYAEHPGDGPGIEALLRLYPNQGLGIAVLGNMNGYQPGRIVELTAEIMLK